MKKTTTSKYRCHYLSPHQPAPYKITGVTCPDGIFRETHNVWCWEGYWTRASIQIGEKIIDGNIYFRAKGYFAMLPNPRDIADFVPNNEQEFWAALEKSQ